MKCIVSTSAALGLFLLIGGCSGQTNGPKRVELHGKVTLDGVPIETGDVHLVPIGNTGTLMTGGPIQNGGYRVTNKGGVIPGEYRVEFTAMRAISPVTLADGVVMSSEQYLPKKFNEQSEFKLTVPADASSLKQDFDLKK